MADKFLIRSATSADCGTLLLLIRDLAEYEHLSDAVIATEESLRTSLFGRNPSAEAVIAEENGTPVGFALFFHNYSTFLGKKGLYLEDLFVKPDCRGRGYGKALLIHLAKIAVKRECGRFEWAVLDWNSPAIDFYKSLGAVPMDEWTVFRVDGDALHKLADS
jgi:GNAT superfamily N-acetyltransferase